MSDGIIQLGTIDTNVGEEKWTQQVHRDCGGEIAVVVKPESRELAAVCKGCRALWFMPQIKDLPVAWENPRSAEPRLIMPGRVY
jgi:hypothetical protein